MTNCVPVRGFQLQFKKKKMLQVVDLTVTETEQGILGTNPSEIFQKVGVLPQSLTETQRNE